MHLFPHVLLFAASSVALRTRQVPAQHAVCRFSPSFSQDEVMHNSASFEASVFYWDGQFHQDGVGYHQQNGLTIDHIALGYATGLPEPGTALGGLIVLESNPRNEAYHIMLLTLAINGSSQASTFIYPAKPSGAAQYAAAVLSAKLQTYLKFNSTYPGYGGFLPDFKSNGTGMEPVQLNRTGNGGSGKASAADNGQLLWAVYGLIHVLEVSERPEYQQLGNSWAKWFRDARTNARNIFVRGPAGNVCAVSTLRPGAYTHAITQQYACERNDCLNNDPFEGELMTWFLYFSNTFNQTEADFLWQRKRSQLIATNYTGSIVDGSSTPQGSFNYSSESIKGRHIAPITTQKGLYFASNEQIKLLFMPYRDVDIVSRVYMNAERVRTCNSVLMRRTPGLFSRSPNATLFADSVNDSLEYEHAQIHNAGIPSAAVFQQQEQDMITLSAVFPTILFDHAVGLAWYKNALGGKQMQSIFGSLAATKRDGSAVARMVNWENKAPTLLALLGGVVDIVRDGMKADNIYDEFVRVTEREYGDVFNSSRNGGAPLMGERVGLCLPDALVPGETLNDFSSCSLTA